MSGGVALHVLDFILLFCINNHCTDFIQSIELIIYHYYIPVEQLSCATCLFIFLLLGLILVCITTCSYVINQEALC